MVYSLNYKNAAETHSSMPGHFQKTEFNESYLSRHFQCLLVEGQRQVHHEPFQGQSLPSRGDLEMPERKNNVKWKFHAILTRLKYHSI